MGTCTQNKNKNVIGTKWVFKNILNEEGKVIRNKERIICKRYQQVVGRYFEETVSTVGRLEAISILLAYVGYKAFKVYQMNVKSSFLNGDWEEEVYNEQPKEFQLL